MYQFLLHPLIIEYWLMIQQHLNGQITLVDPTPEGSVALVMLEL